MTEIVAEIGSTHGGSLENAVRLIQEARRAGADAVKLQCFGIEGLAAKRSKNKPPVELAADFHHQSLIDIYRQIHTPRHWFPKLIRVAEMENIPWFSSVFDPDDVAFLETLNCPR